jgi:hypothetical protein
MDGSLRKWLWMSCMEQISDAIFRNIKVKTKVKFSLWLTKHHAMKTCWGWRCSATILDFSTRREWVVSITPRPLYSWGKSPRYSLDRRLGGPQSQSGRGGEEKNSHLPPRIEPSNPDHPPRSQSLYRLSYPGSYFEILSLWKWNEYLWIWDQSYHATWNTSISFYDCTIWKAWFINGPKYSKTPACTSYFFDVERVKSLHLSECR